jgi:hypothetical protein
MVLQAGPFNRIILSKGNEDAQHFGGCFTTKLSIAAESASNKNYTYTLPDDKNKLH